ncbi:aldehyde dehydrogenase family protein [Haloterrigena salifodinae]|uniref:Aldehyde dehydrogenase family protein n=1 Tax=Haloterrigena salifodinae TaxID=2675099 RepID=A0A8T8E1S8_9EURY|nr:aldehyde dehydrogenase family protein [Haloterrigena salifodinae]QRV15522.1 aldehyde dehydrogenase family protein [Haloterrigena salifodinae]
MLPVVSDGERETVRSTTVEGINGPVAEAARAPTVRVRDALSTAREEGFDALADVPIAELLDRLATAGALFLGEGAPSASTDSLEPFETYRRRVTEATGLPAGWVRTSAHWLAVGLRHAAGSLRAQSPTGELDVYDDPTYTRETTVGLAFTPRVRVLGASMPANDPTVYAWPALALGMRIPIVLRPSDREPFTAIRLARALLAAGIPPSAVHVLPGDRAVGETICREADHALAFGGAEAVAPFRDDPAVETYGPGESVAIVGRDPTDRELDALTRGVRRAGGRACFNLTRIVATGDCDPDALAEGVADRLVGADAGPLHDDRTDVPGFVEREAAVRIDDAIAAIDGSDVTAADRETCLVERDGADRLLPTVLRTDELVPEFPFPFVGVTERERSALPDCLEGAYLAVAIGDDGLERRLVRSSAFRKVYGGGYPASVDLRETHETYLASFLYETTTYDPA